MAKSLKSYLEKPGSTLPVPRRLEEILPEMSRLHETNGGATFSLYFGNQAGARLYSVSVYPERSIIVPGTDIDAEILQGFCADNADLLRDPRCCIGTWFDAEADETYIDVSVVLTRKRDVISLGKRYNQVGVFDLYRMEYVPTGGTGQIPVDAPSEAERLSALRQGERIKRNEDNSSSDESSNHRLDRG